MEKHVPEKTDKTPYLLKSSTSSAGEKTTRQLQRRKSRKKRSIGGPSARKEGPWRGISSSKGSLDPPTEKNKLNRFAERVPQRQS